MAVHLKKRQTESFLTESLLFGICLMTKHKINSSIDTENPYPDAPEELTRCTPARDAKFSPFVIVPFLFILMFVIFPFGRESFSPTDAGWWLWIGARTFTALCFCVPCYFMIVQLRRNVANLKYSRYGIQFKDNFFRWQDLVAVRESSKKCNGTLKLYIGDNKVIEIGNYVAEQGQVRQLIEFYADLPVVIKPVKQKFLASYDADEVIWAQSLIYTLKGVPGMLRDTWAWLFKYKSFIIIMAIIFMGMMCMFARMQCYDGQEIIQRVYLFFWIILPVAVLVVPLLGWFMLFLDNPQITLNATELIVREGDIEKIADYEKIVSYDVVAEGKFQVLVLNIADKDEWRFALPKEPLHSQILERLTEKLSDKH
jgi:hypothetical protein